METLSRLVEEACAALRLQNPARLDRATTIALAKQLADRGLFGYAAAIIDVARQREARDSEDWQKLSQKLVLYTYKDRALPVWDRLTTALGILEEMGIATTANQETLGLAGAVHKRRWEISGKRSDLELALAHYLRGYRIGIASDDGYTAINAAFVLDLLAREMNEALEDDSRELSKRARAIRAETTWVLVPLHPPEKVRKENNWWTAVTLIEAFLGQGNVERAREWLAIAREIPAEPWQRESTLRQLHQLLDACGHEPGQREACGALLSETFPRESNAIRNGPPGRVGLALSGGGFRASLFHLGVLARLAEGDVLRHVEVLSCVSGGSIAGTYYYLALRDLLQSKGDEQITREDYEALIEQMIEVFRRGTRANVRMLALANFKANFRAVFDPNYSRSDRIAELYDEYFFSQMAGAAGQGRSLLPNVGIVPKDQNAESFIASRENWARKNKVPALLLNATSLNTGHSWQFTPSDMGESGLLPARIEASFQLRKIYFDRAPKSLREVPLSRAVAASSCVPALFPPVGFLSLYPGKLVALVDGAIHDNQGVAGLLSEDCRVLLISDAAGHISAMDRPALGYLGVVARSIGILQTRLREAQHRELAAMQRAGVIQMLFLHLKLGAVGKIIDWTGCDIRPLGYVPREPAGDANLASGILPEIQQLLGAMRTDLDAFSDLEASALMYAGYQIAGQYVGSLGWATPIDPAASRRPWTFLAIGKMMSGEDSAKAKRLIEHLHASAKRGGKWLQLSRNARKLGIAVVLVGAGLVAARLLVGRSPVMGLMWRAPIFLFGFFAALLAFAFILQFWRRSKSAPENRPALTQIIFDLLVLTVGWLPAWIDVTMIRPRYLQLGQLETPAREGQRNTSDESARV